MENSAEQVAVEALFDARSRVVNLTNADLSPRFLLESAPAGGTNYISMPSKAWVSIKERNFIDSPQYGSRNPLVYKGVQFREASKPGYLI